VPDNGINPFGVEGLGELAFCVPAGSPLRHPAKGEATEGKPEKGKYDAKNLPQGLDGVAEDDLKLLGVPERQKEQWDDQKREVAASLKKPIPRLFKFFFECHGLNSF